MNYNVKRLTRPIKGICACNYDAVKSIANLANNNVDYRQYNKAFFMRQLGDAMERIEHGENCKLIEPVVPPTLTEARLISELSSVKDADGADAINFYNADVASTGGFLLVLNKDYSLVTTHVIGNDKSKTVTDTKLTNSFSWPLTDRFVSKVKGFIPAPGEAMDYQSPCYCGYDDGQRYYLYGFTS